MQKSDLAIDKYWVNQSENFILATAVILYMSITNGNISFCNVIFEGSEEKKCSITEYNNRVVYACFNNYFSDDSGKPEFNLPPIVMYDSPRKDKRDRYATDLILYAMYVASENPVSTLTKTSDYQQVLVLTSDDPNHSHTTNKDNPVNGRMKIGY